MNKLKNQQKNFFIKITYDEEEIDPKKIKKFIKRLRKERIKKWEYH